MRLDKLEKLQTYKGSLPELASNIDRLIEFLDKTINEGSEVINPNLVAKELGISYEIAIILMGLAEELKIVTHSYQAFTCDSNFPLDEFSDIRKVGPTIYSPDMNEDVPRDKFYLDLVFNVTQ